MTTDRRTLLQGAAAWAALSCSPWAAAQSAATTAPATSRTFDPRPGTWRTFEVTTRVDILKTDGISRVWLPVPSVNTDWQLSGVSSFISNGIARMRSDSLQGVQMLLAEFPSQVEKPYVEVTSRVQTQNRAATATTSDGVPAEDAATLKYFTRPTQLLPTDGIVRETAVKAIAGATSDADKVRAIYDWIVANAWREPKVRGCGEGNIRVMLETGNLGGKCADINALFVGLCRAADVPARDVYGLRLVPSAFGYKQLSGNPANLSGAQHCRAEVYLQQHGWVAMDPADVTKVMRHEAPEWIKTVDHPLVKPVYDGLFGGWEGNWVGWNTAHDLQLPGAKEGVLNFLMYPVAETAEGRVDSYAPDAFKYTITAREIKA